MTLFQRIKQFLQRIRVQKLSECKQRRLLGILVQNPSAIHQLKQEWAPSSQLHLAFDKQWWPAVEVIADCRDRRIPFDVDRVPDPVKSLLIAEAVRSKAFVSLQLTDVAPEFLEHIPSGSQE